MKIKITNCAFLHRYRINGIVLYPFVLYCDRHPDPEIERHEDIHFEQIKRDGVFRFYTRYILDYLKGRRLGMNHHEAYRNIPYEREAFENQRKV